MAQSDSETSDNPQIKTVSNIENELNALEKQCSQPTLDVDIGDTVCAVSNPTVEALIIGKTINQSERLEFLLLLPLYKRKGEVTTPAAVLRKDHEKISRRRVRRYAFPMPRIDKWKAQAKKHKIDYTWTTTAIQSLNNENQNNLDMSPRETPTTQFEENQVLYEDVTEIDPLQQTDKQIIQQLRQKVVELQEKRAAHMDFPMCPDLELSSYDETNRSYHKRTQYRSKSNAKKKNKKSKIVKKSRRHPSTSTNETTGKELSTDTNSIFSSSEEDSSSDDEFNCPFSQHDCNVLQLAETYKVALL